MNDLLPNMMMMDADNNNNNGVAVAVAGGTNNRRGRGRRVRRPALGGPRIAGWTTYVDPTLQGLSNIETMKFEIMKFASLKYEPGEYFITSPISCHGHKWRLKIYPHGEDDYNGNDDPDDHYLSCYLLCCDASTPDNLVKAIWTIHLGRDNKINGIALHEDFKYTFDGSEDDVHGNEDFVTRGEVITNYLDKQNGGSLVIDIDIQVYGQKSTTWYPPQKATRHLNQQQIPSTTPPPGIHYLESSIGTDITFLVGGCGYGYGCGTPKTAADNDDKDEDDDANNANVEQQQQQKFDAHKCILFHRAPGLYEFVKDDTTTSFDLPDVSSNVFKILLNYIYAGKLPKLLDDDDNDNDNDNVEKSSSIFIYGSKELLLVSDRFNLILLKLHIESEIIANILNPNNAAEWLLFADAHSCPYLKESCMDIYADHLLQVKSSNGWKSVKESSDLLEELLEYYATTATGQRVPTSRIDFDNMSVRSLREELESFDLDLDGTREMLIQRLKDHHHHHQTAMSIIASAAAEEEEEDDDDDDDEVDELN